MNKPNFQLSERHNLHQLPFGRHAVSNKVLPSAAQLPSRSRLPHRLFRGRKLIKVTLDKSHITADVSQVLKDGLQLSVADRDENPCWHDYSGTACCMSLTLLHRLPVHKMEWILPGLSNSLN